jgi:hypothetical protein
MLGESYIRVLRTQENEDGLVMCLDNCADLETDATIRPDLSCGIAQGESTVLIIGKVDS